MKIAQVSPLYESVPPKMYGGTERVVSYLTEELVNQGHDVTLFASGDSITEAKLIAPCEKALRLNENCIDRLAHHMLLLEMVQQRIEEFDIIHYHIDYLHFPLSRKNRKPHITTLHGRLDMPDLFPLYKEFKEMPLVSISNSQRGPIPYANWMGTVHHGLPLSTFEKKNEEGKYLAFLGRLSPEKGIEQAIDIAIKCAMPLKIAAKIDKADSEYYQSIKHLLKHPLIEFIGEISQEEKPAFFRNAIALLFPINWPEPFGLVMIESMSFSTPVIAFRRGSVPELIDEGSTGFIVNSIDEAVNAIKTKVSAFNKVNCRSVFEERFTAERMAREYVDLYRQVNSIKDLEEFDFIKI